jgi:hypothetical protein
MDEYSTMPNDINAIEQSNLLIDVFKMEQVFQMGYREGDKVFYVSRRGRRNSLKITFNAFFLKSLQLGGPFMARIY